MDNVFPTLAPKPSTLQPGDLPDAVLWDMDGTIIDTEPQWLEGELALAQRYGATWNQHMGDQLVGMSLPESILIFRDLTGISATPETLIAELIQEMVTLVSSGYSDWRPGARELLTSLRDHHVPCALVTMSYTELANVVLEMLPPGTFDAVVTGDQVSQGKPHPEAYQKAAELLDVDVRRTVALEDSIPGVTSAAASGAWTIGIPAHQSIPSSTDYAVIPTLSEVKPHDLIRLAFSRG